MIYTDINKIGKYSLIMADPPWETKKGGKKAVRPHSSGGNLDYPTMTLDHIKDHLQIVTDHTENDSVLFLWTIEKYLIQAQQIAEEIGWKLHARMIWNKVTGIPASFDIRFGHEYLLYMYKGKLIQVETNERGKIHSVFTEQVKRHSQKPEIAYQIIERLYPKLNKLEMYARRERNGWDSFGNEIIPKVESEVQDADSD
jgi:N6-adenosine-specific RNA methylase IME4